MGTLTGTPIVNLNGQILPANDAHVSVFDRSFLYGDSLYEVVRTYDRKPFGLDEHMKRLQSSGKMCKMPLDAHLDTFRKEIKRTIEAHFAVPSNTDKEVYCRLVVSRGKGKIGFGLSAVETPPLFVIIVQPLNPFTPEQFEKGMHVSISKRMRNDPRALDPAMKSGNYLNSLLAFLEAQDDGCDDAVLCNVDGHVTEGTTFNIFYARRGILATPPLDIGILDGITRQHVMQIAHDEGIEVRETRFPPERLFEADEVFLTGTIKEVFPVTQIDGRKIASGKPGPITSRLFKRFKNER